MTVFERILEYIGLKQEEESGVLLNSQNVHSWPTNGKIEYRNVSMKYGSSDEAKMVLKNISFISEGGLKCGIVGRTGSGKSSLLAVIYIYIYIY